ncbi:tRNA uridine-5-carboxymethylaminomethyl(34) synthesis enzyme MnmG [Candidatus Saccharibacteria bacterium]|nr:tRNA uridine-5-carboxymethylaminomethyl(34) synthesis enzyme MnmG [Candidatus Saccharibacteria bacterium]
MSKNQYQVIVIGAGHAGCEAAIASAKIGARTALITTDLSKVATTPCNPSIGGPGKGNLVREIGALGGMMAKVTDQSAIQIKILNSGKGKAVQAYRAQLDKTLYNQNMLASLNGTKGLDLIEAQVAEIISTDNQITGIKLVDDRLIKTNAVVITAGTFLNGEIVIGDRVVRKGGRIDEDSVYTLSDSIKRLGVLSARLKTGTPPRIARDSIDYDQMELAPGSDAAISFSYPNHQVLPLSKQEPCYLTYTNPETHQVIMDNLIKSPVFSGMINERSPRSCPSLDKKVANFPDKSRHPIFIEPEGRPDGVDGERMYIQGASLAFPEEIQEQIIRTIPGLQNARFIRHGYAVVYDYFLPSQLDKTLMVRNQSGLYLAGQLIGTTGYEEAAALGLIAGINASLKVLDKPRFVLERDQAYIGVLISDLISKVHVEPYRMFTSRAEYRLSLRNDNADLRLAKLGHDLGLQSKSYLNEVNHRRQRIDQAIELLKTSSVKYQGHPTTGYQLLRRPKITLDQTLELLGLDPSLIDYTIYDTVESEIKYSGYLDKQEQIIDKQRRQSEIKLGNTIDYTQIKSLRNEAVERLREVMPETIADAMNIQGITPADLEVLTFSVR